MLPKIYRVGPKRIINKVIKKGRIYKGDFLTLKYLPNGQKNLRLGINIGLWIDKRSTVRNRIKRKIKSFLLEILPNYDKPYDIMLTLRKKPQDLAVLKGDLEKCLKNLP